MNLHRIWHDIKNQFLTSENWQSIPNIKMTSYLEAILAFQQYCTHQLQSDKEYRNHPDFGCQLQQTIKRWVLDATAGSSNKIMTLSIPRKSQRNFSVLCMNFEIKKHYSERTKQMEHILNFQVPAEGLEMVISLHTQY